MSNAAALQTLGLSPGATPADIDRAYRELIKRFHPDRSGGNAARAAEINEAYFVLRKGGHQPTPEQPQSVAEALYQRRARQLRRRKKTRVRIWPVALLLLAALAFLKRDWLAMASSDGWTEVRRLTEPSPNAGYDAAPIAAGSAAFEQPVKRSVIAEAVGRARRLQRSGDEDAMADASRECHRILREAPSLDRLDGCAAFDSAILELQQRDVLRDDGRFTAAAVTARQISGATLLSSDYLAIDARLDQVRAGVQLLLTPPEAAPLPANSSLP